MTPLAQQIVSHALRDGRGADLYLTQAMCFEMSEVLDLATEYVDTTTRLEPNQTAEAWSKTCFLPAPLCWFEWLDPANKIRRGIFVVPDTKGAHGKPTTHHLYFRETGMDEYGCVGFINIDALGQGIASTMGDEDPGFAAQGVYGTLVAFLAIINTPKIVGRREHAPHKGLAKNIKKLTGKAYQLRPWTEIRLEITPPPGGDGSREVLTGKKALHFCRAHLRIRRGRLERVTSHWRGDPALGIVRSRYSVTQGVTP